jgi:hypothetical protein
VAAGINGRIQTTVKKSIDVGYLNNITTRTNRWSVVQLVVSMANGRKYEP